jgi:uncharacterized membrane protein (DUF106 family)
MKTLFKILIWLKNFILTILSIPAYVLLFIILIYLLLIEMGKGKEISKALKEILKNFKK